MMMATWAFSMLLVLGVTSSHLFGLRMYHIAQAKLTNASDARTVLNRVRDEIRSGNQFYVGNLSNSVFVAITNGTQQCGNALQIFPTSSTNIYVCYYLDASLGCLKRQETNGTVQTLAQSVTNQVAFQAEDFDGNALTNYQANQVVQVTLDFYRPQSYAGAGGMYDYYQLQTCMARRTD